MQSPRHARSADLNVTPLIDILLVLLVIFMATLPMSEHKLDTTVPAATRAPGAPADDSQIVVRYDIDGRLSINSQPVTMAALPATLQDVYCTRRDKTLYILGDRALRYGAIVQVIDIAKGAGVVRVGVITEGMRKS